MNKRIKEYLKIGKCLNCQKGIVGKCNGNKITPFFIEKINGKRKYFCNLGCIMLSLNSDKANQDIHNGFIISGLIQ